MTALQLIHKIFRPPSLITGHRGKITFTLATGEYSSFVIRRFPILGYEYVLWDEAGLSSSYTPLPGGGGISMRVSRYYSRYTSKNLYDLLQIVVSYAEGPISGVGWVEH